MYLFRFRSVMVCVVVWRESSLYIPEDASSLSSLLTSQSRLSQNNAQLERFPLMREAGRSRDRHNQRIAETDITRGEQRQT